MSYCCKRAFTTHWRWRLSKSSYKCSQSDQKNERWGYNYSRAITHQSKPSIFKLIGSIKSQDTSIFICRKFSNFKKTDLQNSFQDSFPSLITLKDYIYALASNIDYTPYLDPDNIEIDLLGESLALDNSQIANLTLASQEVEKKSQGALVFEEGNLFVEERIQKKQLDEKAIHYCNYLLLQPSIIHNLQSIIESFTCQNLNRAEEMELSFNCVDSIQIEVCLLCQMNFMDDKYINCSKFKKKGTVHEIYLK